MIRLKLIISLVTLSFVFSYGQSPCANAGFEFGNWNGFEISTGSYGDGVITYGTSPAADQHQVMLINEGFDPIAELLCIENMELPVVGGGLGNYSLRLGNSSGGARAAKIEFELDVTQDVSFLVLNYAVILEDPDHPVLEQPTFQMNITDQDGEVFDCGHYEVTASGNIEGFENCGSWRVRPWTAAGFELQTYIGQTVNIEIITTDCGYGAHGGYAYIDMTCQPLEIILDNYCEDESFAYLTVTEGFDKYEWNTGDSTSQLTIENPLPGTIYSVEVTSATGCSIILTDTLPPFETFEMPMLEQTPDTTFCEGISYWYSPTGTNLTKIFLTGYGQVYDSVLINALTTTTYEFIAKDVNGCLTDTMSFDVNVIPIPTISNIELVPTHCGIQNNGSITLLGLENFMFSIDGGFNFQTDSIFSNLTEGNYTITFAKNNCITEMDIYIQNVNPPSFFNPNVQNVNCQNLGTINLNASGSNLEYALEQEDFQISSYFSGLGVDNYTFYALDEYGCIDSTVVVVGEDLPPQINDFTISPPDCSNENRTVELDVFSFSNLNYYYLDGNYNNNVGIYDNLNAGVNVLSIRDANNCRDTIEVDIPFLNLPKIEGVNLNHPTCNLENGQINVDFQGGYSPYNFQLNSIIQDSAHYTNLPDGIYTIQVIDSIGCIDSTELTLTSITPVSINNFDITDAVCNLNNGEVIVNSNNGIAPYSYSVNNEPLQGNPQFTNLSPIEYNLTIVDGSGCIDSSSFIINAIEPPHIDSVTTVDETCLLNNGSLEINHSFGTAPFEFSLNNVDFVPNNSILNLNAGDYELYILDSNNCLDSTLITVNEKTPPTISNTIVVSETCDLNNGTASITVVDGNPSFQYAIDGNNFQDEANFANLDNGLHIVSVIDQDNCIDHDTIIIERQIPPNLSIDITESTCNLNNGIVNVSIQNGLSNFQYSINEENFQSNNVYSNLSPSNYTISIIDANFCIDSINFQLDSIVPVIITAFNVEQILCGENVVNVSISSNDGSQPVEYSIDGENYQISNDFIEVLSGSYTAYVEDADNCIDSLQIELQAVDEPVIGDFEHDIINCDLIYDTVNISTELGIAPFEYSIDNSPFQSWPYFDSLSPGIYLITVKDAIGCEDTTLLELTTRALPQLENILADDTICTYNNGFINLANSTGISPFSYSLDNITYQSLPVFDDLATGTYNIYLRDAFGCQTQDSAEIEELSNPYFTEYTLSRQECLDSVSQIDLSFEDGTWPFSFSNSSNLQSSIYPKFNHIAEGIHSFYLEDANGCKDTFQIDIPLIDTLELVNLEYEIINCDMLFMRVEAITAQSCKPYTITFNDQHFIFEDYLEIELPIENYYVSLFDACSCKQDAYLEISHDQSFFIPTGFNPESLTGNDVFKVYSPDSFVTKSYQIYDRWGNLIFQADDNEKWWNGTNNGQMHNPGVFMYIIEVLDNCNNLHLFEGDVTLVR